MRVTAALALVVLAPLALAQEAYKIAIKPEVGRVRVQTFKLHMELMSMEIDFEGVSEQTTEKVNPDGSYVVRTKTVSAKQEVDGVESGSGGGESRVVTHDARGLVTAREGEAPDENSTNLSALVRFVPPSQEIRVGDTWQETIPANEVSRMPASKSTLTFRAVEEVAGEQALVIDFVSVLTDESGMGSKGTFWIELATGEIAKFEADLVNAVVQGMQAEGSISGLSVKKV